MSNLRVKNKVRKVQTTHMWDPDQLNFIEKKIDMKKPHRSSRSAIIEHLIGKAQADPTLLD